MTSAAHLIQAGLWRRTKGTGLERFELLRAGDEWLLRGSILVVAEGRPAEARYEVVCDQAWHTRRTDVTLRDGIGERVLRITAENGRWYENGRANETVAGCLDVDLEWSPSTNTIPIRRLGLAIGKASGMVMAAWVRFPDLTLQPLPQEYQRLSEHRYRYTSGGGVFTAEIAVDQEGLVVDYEGRWERVSEREEH